MKAISLFGPRDARAVEIPEPALGPEDVAVRVAYVGLCGSDLNAYRGLSPMVTYPRIPGHEVGGVVAAKGDKVPETVRVGARVTVSPYSDCGLCTACRSGRPNCCQFNRTMGVQRDGALTKLITAHYTRIYESALLNLQELALVEPLAVGYHAANRGEIHETDTALVVGCGMIGIGAIAAASLKGAAIVATDIDDEKLAMARSFGAQFTINSKKEKIADRLRELTGRDTVDVAIEAVGMPATYQTALEAVCFAGRLVCIGYASQAVSMETKKIVSKELDIRGSRNALRVFPHVIRMVGKRERPFAALVTRVCSLDDTAAALSDWDARPQAYTRILISVADPE